MNNKTLHSLLLCTSLLAVSLIKANNGSQILKIEGYEFNKNPHSEYTPERVRTIVTYLRKSKDIGGDYIDKNHTQDILQKLPRNTGVILSKYLPGQGKGTDETIEGIDKNPVYAEYIKLRGGGFMYESSAGDFTPNEIETAIKIYNDKFANNP